MEYDADVIVIGSGALGNNAAYELAKQGKSVIILEAGKSIPRWKITENFRTSPRKNNYNDPYPNAATAPTSFAKDYIENTGSFAYLPGMLKLVGGTTWHWAACAWRYLPSDMKLKSLYGVGRDWPISYDDLEPYYCRAEEALGVSGRSDEDQSGQGRKHFPPRSKEYPMPSDGINYMTSRMNDRLGKLGYRFVQEPSARPTNQPYDGRPACSGNNNCMPVCPIGSMYSGDVHARHSVKAGAKLLTEATAFKLEKGSGNKIEAVHYRTTKGEDKRLTARYFIVAAHGFETPKLLLMSDVANSSDQVGRNIMDHNGLAIQFLADEPLWAGRGTVEEACIVNMRDGNHRRRYAASKHNIGNAVPNMAVAQRLIAQGIFGKELDERIRHDAARWVDISSMLETLPMPSNRVIPHPTKRDALGLPTLSVHYDVPAYTEAAKDIIMRDYRRIAAGMNGSIVNEVSEWQNHDHIMGSVIMGKNPADSVVNGECRSFDHHNLFLATTGVIPAAGVVNPTLTGVALAIRIADIIAREV
ncbi:GMC family oxidoreductase [Zymomonas mobilis]|uniref:GMC family oxidoreductase n=1 Tax=Zymomonas mobilis TaxID=542 RepID=UPI0003C7681E|nr:GMC family oxidoreductase [Zymomonas mobilis]AHB09833.1 choline dehydrogenase-like flavoprotein [Zymomonas mobilis subsp. mobilis str. CP4 = NRRL B-14023]AHJ70138.1 Gluconate 2-dehydrogenase flavoprotein precursor [Zymomonas mobilis subsp. mobilis NRRL B-12526]AHJ71993.1 Gluconate 2-dehydrogenase flavoprotein precursor [Zymomonas mobilis subsp. mobilis str. CP4 = NRRL B-14023]